MYVRVKYPRSYHLPWSLGRTDDDKTLSSVDHFIGKQVVVTEKMDGENTSIYKDFHHARSINGGKHESRSMVAQLQARLANDLPDGMRVCGENCYAKHSIGYSALPDYFLAFSIWNENTCLSWDETVEWAELLGIAMVPVLYRGIYDEEAIKATYIDNRTPDLMEGYVVRIADSFEYGDFSKSLAKFVRKNHVQTSEHWKTQTVVPNKVM
jgi:hypothetical protein